MGGKSAVKPLGERVAALETSVPNLEDLVKEGFKALKATAQADIAQVREDIKNLSQDVKALVSSETARVGAAEERKKSATRRDWILTVGSGLFGSLITAAVQWFRHS